MKTYVASFDDANRAADCMAALIDHGVAENSMDLVANSSYGDMLVKRKHNEYAEKATGGITTTTGADAVEGAKAGGVIGIGAGVLAGLASLIIPGYGVVIGGGALATALGSAIGTTAAGAAVGGITGYLRDMGATEKVAIELEDTVSNGGAVLTVTMSDPAAPGVVALFEKYRAGSVLDYNRLAGVRK